MVSHNMIVLFSFLCAHGQISVTTMTTINQNRPQIGHEKGIIRPRCTGPGINQAGEEMGQRREVAQTGACQSLDHAFPAGLLLSGRA